MFKINSSARPPGGDRLGRELATAVIAFHESLARRVGMSAAESRVLTKLNELGVATPSRLAQETGLTTGAITGIVDRLEKAGYARREPNPDDRRSLLVRPDNQDRLFAHMGPVFASLSAAMTDMASQYTPEELAVAARYVEDMTRVLRAETMKLKAKP
jgi:DNA-binding MarR family transcriptional regulator